MLLERLQSFDWALIGLLSFAGVFFVVGVARLVEFSGLGLGEGQKRLLSCLHVLGCAIFASSLGLEAFDLGPQKHRILAIGLFVVGLAVLGPGQFTIGMRRRRHLERERLEALRRG